MGDDSSIGKEEVHESASSSNSSTLLTVEQYHTLTRRVYEQRNPVKLQDLPALFAKYRGREHDLFRQVCEKYNANPDELAASLPINAATSTNEPAAAKAVPEHAGSREVPVKREDDEFAHLENEELPQLTATEYAVLIQSVYERYNPKKLQDMGRLLQKYRSRERDLYFDVCKKYGAHPVKFRAMDLKEKSDQQQ